MWDEDAPERTVSFFCVPPTLQLTWDPPEGSVLGRKPEPFNVNVNCALPAGALAGLMLVRPGSGFGGGLMMKALGLDRPLFPAPLAGFTLIIVATPHFATQAARTVSAPIFPRAPPLPSPPTLVPTTLPF